MEKKRQLLGANWPMEKRGDIWHPMAYSPDSDWMIFGRPRCPGVSPEMIEQSDSTGIRGAEGFDHFIGQCTNGCSFCQLFANEGQKAKMHNYGAVWQWIKRKGLTSAKRPYTGLDADALRAMADNATELAAAFDDVKHAAQGTAKAAEELAVEVKDEDAEEYVPLLVKRRWIEEARKKKRRHAG
jgi:hypothetical protein